MCVQMKYVCVHFKDSEMNWLPKQTTQSLKCGPFGLKAIRCDAPKKNLNSNFFWHLLEKNLRAYPHSNIHSYKGDTQFFHTGNLHVVNVCEIVPLCYRTHTQQIASLLLRWVNVRESYTQQHTQRILMFFSFVLSLAVHYIHLRTVVALEKFRFWPLNSATFEYIKREVSPV